jgi:hypothetical protein
MRGTKANNKKTVKKNLTRMAIILLSTGNRQ